MPKRPLKALKNEVLFVLVAGIYFFFNALPLSWARGLGAGLGRLFFMLVPYERKKTLRQLELAFPEEGEGARRHLAGRVFSNLGRGAAEFMRFGRLSYAQIDPWVSSCSGFEHIEAGVKDGRGVVAVTAHVGHWELLAAYTAARLPVAVVARQVYDGRLNETVNALRRSKAITVFERNTSVKPILRWLKDGKVLGVLCDQDTGVDSVFVEFFGRLAKTPSGAAWLAQATGAALVTAFCRRDAEGRYVLEYQPELKVPPRGEDFTDLVREYTARTESFIRRVPDQWAWNHNRWRTQPSSASSSPVSPS